MRVALLLALAGCNQIFGLTDQVDLVDAPVAPPDAAFPTARISYLVAQTRVIAPDIKGVPDPALQRPALDDPQIKIGTLTGVLEAVAYDTTAATISVPPAVFDSSEPWRLQYRVGDVPHDVVWTTSRDTPPTIVVPVFGRLARTPPPLNSGFDIRPTGTAPAPPAIGSYRAARVFTTGVFADILVGSSPSDTRVDAPMTGHISGPRGTPDASQGDAGVLANYGQTTFCEHLVNGYAEFLSPPLVADNRAIPLDGSLAPGQPEWRTNGSVTETTSVTLTNVGSGLALRLFGGLDSRIDMLSALDAPLYQIGFAASDQIPILTPTRPISFLKSNVLTVRNPPGPLMFLLAQCGLDKTPSDGYIVPIGLEPFPRVAYGVATNRRAVAGVELLSSIVTVDKPSGNAVTLDFGVPLAIDPITLSDGTSTTLLSGLSSSDGVTVSPAAAFELDFALEPDAGGPPLAPDYVEVTVFQIDNQLVPIHVYRTALVARESDQTLVRPIRIDGTELLAGNTYVLQIQTVRGAPNAAVGDFETIAFPQSMATIFTRSFVIQ
jgi:hypothetical protein